MKHGSGGRVGLESPVLLAVMEVEAGLLTVPEFLLHVLSNCSRLSCHLPLSDAGQKERLHDGEEQDEVETVMVKVAVEEEEAQEVASQRGRWRRGKQGFSEATFDYRRGHDLVQDYY